MDFKTSTPPPVGTYFVGTLPINTGARTVEQVAAINRSSTGVSTPVVYNVERTTARTLGSRTTFKGLTLTMTASSLYDGGTLMAAQHDPQWERTQELGVLGKPSVPTGTLAISLLHSSWPLSETDMALQCPGAHNGAAKEGCYLPFRLLGPINPFGKAMPSSGLSTTNGLGASSQIVNSATVGPLLINSATTIGVCPFYDRNNFENQPWWVFATASANTVLDTCYDNWATGVVIARGISDQASFTLQAYIGQQQVVDDTSVLRVMVQAPPPYDPLVARVYSDLIYRVPFAYPAKDNLLGLTLPGLAAAARMIVPHIGGVIRTVAPGLGKAMSSAMPYIAPVVSGLLGEATAERAIERRERVQSNPPRRERSMSVRSTRSLKPALKQRKLRLTSAPRSRRKRR